MNGECTLYFSSDSSSSAPLAFDPLALDPLALDDVVLNEGNLSASVAIISEETTNAKKKTRVPSVIPDYITVVSSRCGKQLLYECKLCSKKFKTKAHIKYHEYCKTGNKPFKCETCGQGFIASSHYAYHLKTHTGERPYACTLCEMKFIRQSHVTRHMKSQCCVRIRNGAKQSRNQPHTCDKCTEKFARKKDLRHHLLLHAGMSTFRCRMCSNTFSRKDNLLRHMQHIHNISRDVARRLCNEATTTQNLK